MRDNYYIYHPNSGRLEVQSRSLGELVTRDKNYRGDYGRYTGRSNDANYTEAQIRFIQSAKWG